MHYCASNNDMDGMLHLAARGADIFACTEEQPLRPVQLMECSLRVAVINRICNWNRRSAFLVFLYGTGLLSLETKVTTSVLSMHGSSATRLLSNYDLTRLIIKAL